MIIQGYRLEKNGGQYDVILYIKESSLLEEFAEEFGSVTRETERDINRLAVGYVRNKLSTIKVKSIKVIMGGVVITTIMFSGNMAQAFANELETTTETETTTDDAVTDTTSDATATDTGTTADTTSPDGTTTETMTNTTTEETTQTEETVTTEPVPEGTEGTTMTTDERTTEEPTTTTDETTTDDPGLLPGDFFYFVKILSEKISLALTFDDVEKAQKLADYAAERIAEANALLAEGDIEGATATLQKALENQELALDYSDQAAKETGTAEGDDTTDAVIEVQRALEEQFTANTMALLLAMEKVDNPAAKEALAKNVEKSFERMSKKLDKLAEVRDNIQEKIAKGKLNDVEDFEDELKDLHEVMEDDQEVFEEKMQEVEEKNKEAIAKSKNGKDDLDEDAEGVDEERSTVAPTAPKKAENKSEKKPNQKKQERNNVEEKGEEEGLEETQREEVKREAPKKDTPKQQASKKKEAEEEIEEEDES